MNDIGKEYGAALFMLASEESAREEYAKALDSIRGAFAASPEYALLLSSLGIVLSERLSAIEEAFGDTVPSHVLSFVQLMCEKGRLSCINAAIDEYFSLLDASKHVSNARVTSAVELTDGEKEKLTARLEAICRGKVNIEYFIDEKLLGGLVVEIDGKIMDGSLRQRLREIKEVISI